LSLAGAGTAGHRSFRIRAPSVLRRAWKTPGGKIGLISVLAVLAIAVVGPLLAPYPPLQTVGRPFLPPSAEHLFGTDFLGRDALSRFLAGGIAILALAVGATVLAYVIGVPLGMFAGLRRAWPDVMTLGLVDIILAFPSLILILLIVALAGAELWVVVVGIAAAHTPRIVRIMRSITIEAASLEYVEAAFARGETMLSVLRRELLPNMWTPIIADAGIRLTGSFLIAASLGYLGIGLSPPAPNWGVMVSENRIGLNVNPLTVLPPALALAAFAIGINLFADAMLRALGRSVLARDV
jgi:peptide/nickel transport system permease protein